VRDDARTRAELPVQFVGELVVGVLLQEQEDDVGIGEILPEEVPADDRRLIGEPRAAQSAPAPCRPSRIDLDADALRSILGDGHFEYPSVARAEVEDDLAGLDVGRVEHASDPLPAGGLPGGSPPLRPGHPSEHPAEGGGERIADDAGCASHTPSIPAAGCSPPLTAGDDGTIMT
jgi:hypothetical protein